jgi:hypothetical protein
MTTFPSDRDPRVDPRPGDVLVLHHFGSCGTEFAVTRAGLGRRGSPSGAREERQVACRLRSLGGLPIDSRGRIYALAGWPAFMREAEVTTTAPEAPNVGP